MNDWKKAGSRSRKQVQKEQEADVECLASRRPENNHPTTGAVPKFFNRLQFVRFFRRARRHGYTSGGTPDATSTRVSTSEFWFKPISLAVSAIVAVSIFVSGCGRREAVSVSEKNVQTLTKENFKTEVLAASQPVLVDFWATWCGPCRMVAPTVAEIATEFEGKAKVGKVDVDAQTELAQQYNISAIPALLIFKDGKVVQTIVGVQPKSNLKAALEKFVDAGSAPKPTNSL